MKCHGWCETVIEMDKKEDRSLLHISAYFFSGKERPKKQEKITNYKAQRYEEDDSGGASGVAVGRGRE